MRKLLAICTLLGCSDPTGNSPDGTVRDAQLDLSTHDVLIPSDATPLDISHPMDGQLALPDAAPDVPDMAVVPDTAVPDVTIDAGQPECRLAIGPMVDTPMNNGVDQATVSVVGPACARTYTLRTTANLRDNQPVNPRVIEESGAIVRTNNPMFDALYALAGAEARENMVDSITDFAFNDGQPVACGLGGCFETGRLWRYVWTRDTGYAVDLALGVVDPLRARNSLAFKISTRRGEPGTEEIVQDTGTGGSFPVSTDRVIWALGAQRLLSVLAPDEYAEFAPQAARALGNTYRHNLAAAFNPELGLFSGEQSFLDWREQSYPRWVEGDPAQIAMSYTLATNIGHLVAAQTYDRLNPDQAFGVSEALKSAIREHFYSPEDGLFAAMIPTDLHLMHNRQFDLLGNALAVLYDVATPEQATSVVAHYPHVLKGPPVLWPQQQFTPIYHNRGQWPFVTAYWIKAAAKVHNAAVVDHNLQALMRGAALNLSNMENFELVTGLPWLDDGDASGPVVNSQRQLWSVAGYLSVINDVVFGLQTDLDPIGTPQITIAPFITRWMVDTLFPGADRLVLDGLKYRGHALSITLNIPAGEGHYLVAAEVIKQLGADDLHFEVQLQWVQDGPGEITVIEDLADYQNLYGPRTPELTEITLGDTGSFVQINLVEPADEVTWSLFQNGVPVVIDEAAELPLFVHGLDPQIGDCFVVESRFSSSGTRSQHSKPWCFWGNAIQEFGTDQLAHQGGQILDSHGRRHIDDWGDPEDTISVEFAAQTGRYWVQATYGNGAGGVTTGITCAVKQVQIIDIDSGAVVSEGVLKMPHTGDWATWRESTVIPASLEAGRRYRMIISEDSVVRNMSVFSHFETYTGGLGGREGTYNRVNISALKLLYRGQR